MYTCGRPGRAIRGRSREPIGDDIIDEWVDGLPAGEVLHIVSLLGKKRDGFSEFDYYPFRSSRESGAQPTFQEWLDQHYQSRFVVHEFPTRDCTGIPSSDLKEITNHIRRLLEDGETVVVIDSAGAERTARVCEALGYEPSY
jgi:hypothetical protein